MHCNTLSIQSKEALLSGNMPQMLNQLKKLQSLYNQGSARNKGPLHRHFIAMKQQFSKQRKQLTKNMDQLRELLENAKDSGNDISFPEADYHSEPSLVSKERCSLSKRHMKLRKRIRFTTNKRAKAINEMEEKTYQHYYLKLTKLTKMRESLPRLSYTSRSIARSEGMCLNTNISYKERFRNLLYKVVAAWRPRDFIQRVIGSGKMHSLCIDIIHYIREFASLSIDTITNVDIIDNLFRILRRFKISSPVFRLKCIYQGGGPKKCLKKNKPQTEQLGTQNVIGKDELPVKVVNSLSAILKGQFDLEHGLVNVRKLYRASKMTGSISQKLKGYDLQPVPTGSHALQVHYCDNHYVTSEQTKTGITVWDSVQTTEQFKVQLYSQLQLTYDIVSGHKYSDQPEGLIIYKTDQNNMQKDAVSCGLFAVMRAYFILSNTSSQINTDIARAYLSSVLTKYEFPDYDIFSSHQRNVQMQVVMEKYMRNQKKLQTKKSQEVVTDSTRTVSENPAGNTERRGRPKKRRYVQEENKARSDTTESVTDSLARNVTNSPVRKRDRPATKTSHEAEHDFSRTASQNTAGNTARK